VRHYGLASQSCPQSTQAGAATEAGQVAAPAPAPAEVWAESHCGADFLLGSAGHAGGQAASPVLAELVTIPPRFSELDIEDDTAPLLAGMSGAAIVRRLAGEREKHQFKGRSRTKAGTLLKSQIPVRTWTDWGDAAPATASAPRGGVHTGHCSLTYHAGFVARRHAVRHDR
jgi:hypothetical protein